MCPETTVKVEQIDGAGLSDLLSCEHTGAKAEKDAPELLVHSETFHQRLSKPKVEEDNDDVLTSLCAMFDGMWDASSDDDSKNETDSSAPSSPRSRGGLDLFSYKTYFCTAGGLYYYDQDHNVFTVDAYGNEELVHRGQSLDLNNNILDDGFYIDGMFHFFGLYDNLCYNSQGTTYAVVPLEQTPVDPTLGSTFLPTSPDDIFQSNSAYVSAHDLQNFSQAPVSNGTYCDPAQTKTKVEAATPKSNPLNSSLQGSMPWSPSSSTMSPIVSAGSRAPSESYEPLIPADSLGAIAGIQLWKQETRVIQQIRHAPPTDKMERRRCPLCQKLFRRPSSLEDHLNVHSGAKPHVCPYEACKTGFATKSNMKRHFTTHRLGSLEEYYRGVKSGKSKSLTSTYNAKAFHTQRYRLV